ncbi:DIE2/ALG10 family-domain-containing protein [Apodospora peruviana]|uniref:Dol-P-Glc:Glc(2)Man(9)GlcNAc(2)-PP-Dol alpha-1,2-glucosyltransferase n=1 Tax=Apodospora peruviana TaxID=516989 RepID=A0AAE0LYF9_9PEZI|nr:DIE2/ALG10 family-domain-containing protein [Apodospora peruviana]
MEVIQVLRDSLTLSELVKGAAISLVLSRFLAPSSTPHKSRSKTTKWQSRISNDTANFGGFFFIFLFARSWLAMVDKLVPDPYLDEVFHIPQAQKYCEGRYWDWDDKITTPPGLYLLSVVYHKLWMLGTCTPLSLRSNNLFAVLLTALLAGLCRNKIEARQAERDGITKKSNDFSFYAYHSAINIALFPVLFFFSALYYTDVVSTLLVLVAYHNHLGRVGPEAPSLLNHLWTVTLGVAALFMRQTNVFWVVVYMGGLEVLHAVRSLKPAAPNAPVRLTTLSQQLRFHLERYSVGDVHDPPLDSSWPDDWAFCLLTIAIAAICNPLKVLKQVWPHITVLGLFAGFVLWNGGVVLGDKSNHIATIHLAQMLYIWPFFAFFSAPLLIPSALSYMNTLFNLLIAGRHPAISVIVPSTKVPSSSTPADQKERSLAIRLADLVLVNKIYYLPYLFGSVLLSLAVAKFNTIIHPFTLADNRHYMFYVFRYTIRHSLRRRYLLVAAYTASRWLVWTRLAGNTTTITLAPTTKPTASTNRKSTISPGQAEVDEQPASSSTSPSTSTVLLWLLATSLSLITAPLVEPRYFVLPWVFFRLLMPAWQVPQIWPRSLQSMINTVNRKVDITLAVETVWFVAINLGTMYMFLYRPFYWKSSDGELLDDGKVQRFMW